jgi:transcription initiation factor TFIIIB Brf1 subunit/transcription initiation factor TFIIB
MYSDNCEHQNIITEHSISSCAECGMEVVKNTSDWLNDFEDIKNVSSQQYCIRKVKTKSLYDDIQHLNISQRIKDIANDIYLSICENTRRGVTRRGIIFGCLFHAFKIIENPQTCDKLTQIFNIERKDALNGLKYIHKNAPKQASLRHAYISVENIICDFMIKFNTSLENKEQILNLYRKIKNVSSMLNRRRPQSVSAGIIYYYMTEVLKRDISIKDYRQVVKLSELTIQKICKEVSRLVFVIEVQEAIKRDDISFLEKNKYDLPLHIYKKICIKDEEKSLNIEKYRKIDPLEYAKQENAVNCITFLEENNLK